MQANFKNVAEATGLDEAIPEGAYKCICTNYVEDMTKGSANNPPCALIRLTWQVAVGEYQGTEIEDAMFFSVKGVRRAKSVCRRLGIKKNLDEDIELEAADFLGVKALVNVEHEHYKDRNDKERIKNRVQFYPGYNEPPAAASAPAASSGKTATKAKPAQQPAPSNGGAPASASPPPAAAADDDNPPWWGVGQNG